VAADPQPQKEVVSLSIPSRLEMLGLLDRVAEQLCERLDFPDEDRSNISMSVIEAGTNAIQHGHHADPKKTVVVRFEMQPDRLTVVVHDNGSGFSPPAGIHDITSPEHLLDLRGRGIFIMQTCMDEVKFDTSDTGTTVRMIKIRKPNPNGSPSAE